MSRYRGKSSIRVAWLWHTDTQKAFSGVNMLIVRDTVLIPDIRCKGSIIASDPRLPLKSPQLDHLTIHPMLKDGQVVVVIALLGFRYEHVRFFDVVYLPFQLKSK